MLVFDRMGWGFGEHSGAGFASQDLYLHGFFSASIKLPSDYAAGVVVAFYVSLFSSLLIPFFFLPQNSKSTQPCVLALKIRCHACKVTFFFLSPLFLVVDVEWGYV